jgi:hypothetical protein
MLLNRNWRELIAMLHGFRNRWIRPTIASALLVGCGLSPLPVTATLLLGPDGITVYDTVNNISWHANANLAASSRFGLPVCNGSGTQPCINPSGSMSYQTAKAWVTAMNAAVYLGHTDWQLPTTPFTDSCPFTGPQGESFGFNCAASALGSLYYNALGLKAPNAAVPIPANATGPFSNFQPYLYWSQTSTAGTGVGFGTFSFNTGFHGSNSKPNFLYVLPMIQGKIPGTPPASGNDLEVNPDGQTIYDPVTNVTWLTNANLAATNTFGLPPCENQGTPKICVNQDGAMNWDSANQFVTNMNTFGGAGYLGQTNWELPPLDPNCNVSYNCASTSDPFEELFYGQLGLSPGAPVVATPDIAVGPFKNIQPYLYWSCQGATVQDTCETVGPAPGFEWSFSFGNGFLGTDVLANDLYVMVYYPGSPTVVPTNYQGLWWAAPAGVEAGWGINFAHQGDVIFASWFTYDATGNAWWLSMTANKIAEGAYSGTLLQTSGPAFSAAPFNPSQVTRTPVGSGTLTFSSASSGTFAYTVNGIAQTKVITLQQFGPLPICMWSSQPNFASVTNYQDLWWAAPAGVEAGWGVNLTHQGSTIFATWFTYDANHNPLWYSATATQTAPNVFSGSLIQTSGPAFSAVPFDPTQVQRATVGSATFMFTDGITGTFSYTVGGVTQTKNITRQLFQPPAGTVCQ